MEFRVHDVDLVTDLGRYGKFLVTTWADSITKKRQPTQDSWVVKSLDRQGIVQKPPGSLEAASEATILPGCGLVYSVGLAYNEHYALTLSPDHLWLTIAHGVSQHVTANAEALRSQFVTHEGQKHIHVEVDHFVRGGNNPWPDLFQSFETQIREHVPADKMDMLACNFSTTTPVELAVSHVLTMATMSKYFTYGMSTLCGFPKITLEGTPEDWDKLVHKVQALRSLDLDWWLDILEPVVVEIAATARGTVSTDFWKSMYQEGGGSGGPYISGWVNAFYPYMRSGKQNRYLEPVLYRSLMSGSGMMNGPKPEDFPDTLGSVPVIWNYYGTLYDMEFQAGLGGSTFDERGIRPAATWAIFDVTEE